MKKNKAIIIVIVFVLLAVGGYALLHASKKNTVTSTQTGAVNNTVLVTKTSASLGQYLATPGGQALYTSGGDSQGVSNCSGTCLASWPAYQDKGVTTGLPTGVGTIQRKDNGQIQYTYNGLPLYTFTGDSDGQVTGNGVSNFSVVKPIAANSNSTSSSSSQPAANGSSSSW
ncbi:MAG TPA: hypothetical protein VGS08_04595 [Candidatus Saccharimonadales bacterium]|nr:hypothetical protein [Candidatus Saccharimonadales bacterium]